jgi:CheY-like chemotaxis protein
MQFDVARFGRTSFEGTKMPPLKLLVVEDNTASLELMTEVFASLKADVRPLSDSQEAELLVNQEQFDGIFLDLEMPRLNGFQLAEKVRKSSRNKSTPIIIVTGHEERDAMHRCFTTGATFFLQKPVDRHKLTRLFRTVRGTMVENRRRSIRVPLQTSVTCLVGGKTLPGKTWNLSLGGMQVEVDSLLSNQNGRFSFELPDSHTKIDVLGTVVWTKDERQGIKFTKVAPKIQDQIRNFVETIGSSLK